MSADLMLPLKKVVPFNDVLLETHVVLQRILNLTSPDPLAVELPPSKKMLDVRLSDRLVDATFPGAYVRFSTNEESVVDFGVFEGGTTRERLLVGCGTAGTPAADVLTAALAAASAQLMGSIIIDAGTHWTENEECLPIELISRLALKGPAGSFEAAIDLAHKNQSSNARHRAKW